MTGRRYFYRDPLAAAWMAKYFGVRLQAVSLIDDEMVDVSFMFLSATVEVISEFSDNSKFYIHPDCCHLLEPQRGDMNDNGDYWNGEEWWQKTECTYPNDEIYKIIERNGIPFMWPESEPV